MNSLSAIIKCDLYRYRGNTKCKTFWSTLLTSAGFKYMFWFRCASYYRKKGLIWLIPYIFCQVIYKHYVFKYGIDIPIGTTIGKGFYIGHFSGIIVHGNTIIGQNVNISQGVTIGTSNRGGVGTPEIGNSVYIGPGVKIIGKIRIGNNVAIGANAVVTKDIPDNAVAVGIPAKVISSNGSDGYINNIVE